MRKRRLSVQRLENRSLMAALTGPGPADSFAELLDISTPSVEATTLTTQVASTTAGLTFGDIQATDEGAESSVPENTVSADQGIENFPQDLLDKITAKTVQKHEDVGSIFSNGWINNLGSAAGYGMGCAAWSDATRTILIQVGINGYENFDLWFGPFRHQAIRFQLPNDPTKTWYVADPWRDGENPIWSQDKYVEHVGVPIYGTDGNVIAKPANSADAERSNDLIGEGYAGM